MERRDLSGPSWDVVVNYHHLPVSDAVNGFPTVVNLLPHYLRGIRETVTAAIVGSELQLLNCLPAEVENSLPERLVGIEGQLRAAFGYSQDGGRVENGVAGEIRRPRYLLHALTDLGEGIEEVPEGSTVGDGVIHGASYEHPIGELGDLDGGERVVVAGIRDGVVVDKKLLKATGHIHKFRGVNCIDTEVFRPGLNKIHAGIIAEDVNIAEIISDEAAGEGGEMGKSERKGVFEEDDEIIEGVRREGKQNTLLNVMAREHRKIRDRKLESLKRGFLIWVDSAFGDNGCGRRRHDCEEEEVESEIKRRKRWV